MTISEAISSFKYLNKQDVISLSDIKKWHDCYRNLYLESKKVYDSKSIKSKLQEFGSIESTDCKFRELYTQIEEIINIQKLDIHCQNAFDEFFIIKNDSSSVKTWIDKNEILGSKELACFLIDYLDYDVNSFHLNLFVPSYSDGEIFIHRNDFNGIIRFLEIFDACYWLKPIHKEIPDPIPSINVEYPLHCLN